jgi:hypothetical protein
MDKHASKAAFQLLTKCKTMVASSRKGSFADPTLFSLGMMPFLMGVGHLAPAIGAIRTATGTYQLPGALLGMIGTASALVDCMSPNGFNIRID